MGVAHVARKGIQLRDWVQKRRDQQGLIRVLGRREGDWVDAIAAGDPATACTLFHAFGSICLPCASDGQSYCLHADHIKQVAAYDAAVPEMAVLASPDCTPTP